MGAESAEPVQAWEGLASELGPVAPACESDTAGHWYCVTHDEHFPHNFGMHSHVGDPRDHVIAWVCHEHGPEVP